MAEQVHRRGGHLDFSGRAFPQGNVVVVSHRRSGTHLAIDAIRNNVEPFKTRKNPVVNLDLLNAEPPARKSIDEIRATFERSPQVFKTHAHADIERFFPRPGCAAFVRELLERSKSIYMVRDGRDVLVSLYHYMRSFDKRFSTISFGEFIRMHNDFDVGTYDGVLNRVAYWAHHVESWIAQREVLQLRYEAVIANFDEAIRRIALHLGRPLPARVLSVVRSRRFETSWIHQLSDRIERLIRSLLTAKKFTSVGFRRGGSGEHRTVFAHDDLVFFEKQCGPVLTSLGYESAV